jgi:hypothetical protein
MILGSILFPDRVQDHPGGRRLRSEGGNGYAKSLGILALVGALILAMMLLSGTWEGFWKAFLIVTLSIFAILAVVVTYGGFLDIRSLFQGIQERHRKEGEGTGDRPGTRYRIPEDKPS